MGTLYDLEYEFLQLYNMLEDDEIDETVLNDTLEAIMFDERFEEKAEGYAKIIRMLEAESDVANNEAKRLSKKAKAKENKADKMRSRLCETMMVIGKRDIKTPLFNLKVQQGKEKVIVDDINKFLIAGEDCWIPRKWNESELNKTYILEALQSGQTLAGAHLERGESLYIR